MKSLLFLSLILGSQISYAAETVSNCYARGTEFFINDLEEIRKDKMTSVPLLNISNEVVGVISVDVKDSEVSVQKLSLCGKLQVSDFYYTDEISENLLKWKDAKAGTIRITQDEGMIVINVKEVKASQYAVTMAIDFNAYDVFEAKGKVDTTQPGYEKEWGLPKAGGNLHFYLPKTWK